jgi:hypothetical protein
MPGPVTQRSHTRSAVLIASGLYVSGGLTVAGSVVMSTHMTGVQLATGSIKGRHLATAPGVSGDGVIFSAMLGRPSVSTHSAASGTVVEGWTFVAHRAITIRAIGIHFGTAPQGNGPFSIKVLSVPSSGSAVGKAVCSASVGGTKKVLLMSNFSSAPTIPARSAVALAVKAVGATVAGRGGKPTIHYTYN